LTGDCIGSILEILDNENLEWKLNEMSDSKLLEKYQDTFHNSLKHLHYSYKRVGQLPEVTESSTESELEAWESFSSRFARSTDLFVSQILRLKVKQKDPVFRGGVIDILNESEKFGWITDAKKWWRIRELRNVAAHEYAIADLPALYAELVTLCPTVFAVEKSLCV
jgi:hypothetical protein